MVKVLNNAIAAKQENRKGKRGTRFFLSHLINKFCVKREKILIMQPFYNQLSLFLWRGDTFLMQAVCNS